jgi:hypothetical protein
VEESAAPAAGRAAPGVVPSTWSVERAWHLSGVAAVTFAIVLAAPAAADVLGRAGRALRRGSREVVERAGLASHEPRGFALLIDSEPAGASVVVDGAPRGRSPALLGLECVPGAPLVVEVRMDGFNAWRYEDVCREDATVKVRAVLERGR